MANAAAFIQQSIWRDEHWRSLSRAAQALYLQLLSQKELDCAGILPLQPNKWAKGCNELTAAQVVTDLDELQQARFVYYDVDTDELFVRSYMRNSNVMKSPNMRRAATRAAVLVGSEFLKPLLAAELRAVGEAMNDAECLAAAEKINPSGTPPEPFPKGSNRTVREPFVEPSGVGEGVGTGVTLASNHLGEEPPQFCSSHPNGTDKGCHPCGRARLKHEAWLEDQQQNELEIRRRAKQLRDNCPVCEGTNWIPNTDPAEPCNHQEAANA